MPNNTKDEWQLKLDKQLIVLKDCQLKNNVNSCMKCQQILQCDIRRQYIIAVYESMNKGSTGGFEF